MRRVLSQLDTMAERVQYLQKRYSKSPEYKDNYMRMAIKPPPKEVDVLKGAEE
jgi:hypothetical protein